MSRSLEAVLARRRDLIAKSDAHRSEIAGAIHTWTQAFGWMGRFVPAFRVARTVFGIVSKFR